MMPTFQIILAATGLLIAVVSGVSVGLMRAEGKTSVELHASGAILTEPSREMDEDYSLETDMCDLDYPLGKDGCGCHDGHNQILQEEMCIQAAKEAGATAPQGKFKIGSEYFHKRPKGCFKFPCSEDPRGICYFYNPIGNTDGPAKCANTPITDSTLCGETPCMPEVEGMPVCSRPKYLNGSIDGVGDCPAGYQVVMNENNCSEEATCLGYCEGAEFREAVMNHSMHDEFPEGCFIHKVEGCVYYNPPLPAFGNPARPKGTSICNVTSTVSYAHLPVVNADAVLHWHTDAPSAAPAAADNTVTTDDTTDNTGTTDDTAAGPAAGGD